MTTAIKGVSDPFNEYLNQLVLQIRGGRFSGAVVADTGPGLGIVVDEDAVPGFAGAAR